MHTPDSAQLFDLLHRLHDLVGPDFGGYMSDKKDFIHECYDWFNHAIPQDKKREFILSFDKSAVIDEDLDLALYSFIYNYLMGTPPPRSRRGASYRTEGDEVTEVPTEPPFDTTLPNLDRSKHRKSIFDKGEIDTRMPIVQLLTDLKTMHDCM
jgi:hypothetical protein